MDEDHATALRGELPSHHARLHWIVFGRMLFAVVVAVLFLAAQQLLLGLLFLLAGLGFLGEAVLRVRGFSLALEADRVTASWGLTRRDTLEVPIGRLRSISVRQGPAGRLLGYGTVVITSSAGGESTFRSVAAPFVFRLAVLHRLDDLQSRTTEVVTRPTVSL